MDDDFYVQLQEASQNEVDNEKLPELAVSEEYDCSIADNEALDVAIHYDRELVAKIIGLDIDSFNKLLEEYIETSHQLCKNIVTSAKNGDFNSSKESASELKGMSNNMRIHELDDELNDIINSNNSEVIEKNVSAITVKIDQISNTKDKQ